MTRASLSGHFLGVAVDIRAWLNRAGVAVEFTWMEDLRGPGGPSSFVEVAPCKEEHAKRFLSRLHGVDWYALGDFDPGGTDGTWFSGELVGATGQRHHFSARSPADGSPWKRFVAAHVELAADSLRGLRSTEVLDALRSHVGLPTVHIRNFKGTPQVVRVSGALGRPPDETLGLLQGIELARPLVVDLAYLQVHKQVEASLGNAEAVLSWARDLPGAHVVLPLTPDLVEKDTGFDQPHADLDAALAACVN